MNSDQKIFFLLFSVFNFQQNKRYPNVHLISIFIALDLPISKTWAINAKRPNLVPFIMIEYLWISSKLVYVFGNL